MQDDQIAERRKSLRQRVFLGGKITTDLHFEPFECVIRDLTIDGARLVMPANEKLPERFRLAIPAKECMMRVRSIWRSGKTIGVYFDGFEYGGLEPGTHVVAENAAGWRH